MKQNRKVPKPPRDLRAVIHKKPTVFAVYLILRIVVLLTLVSSIIRGEYENAFVCLLVLFLFMLPLFIQQNFGIELPSTLEFELSPVYVSLVAFCFSMTIGVLWEFFEFGMDRLFLMDMQKDTIIHSITSVMLDPTNMNIPVTIGDITSVAVNGQELGFGGYLDIGLYDTMEDLFVNFIGALVFSFIGYFYIKRRGEGKIAKAFIPTITEPKPEEGPAEVPATPTTEEE